MRLFLCEKPSQAKDIAKVLGAHRRGDGCWLGTDVCVTWCIGHLLETAPPDSYDERYKRWSLDDLPIIPEKWKMTVKPKTASQYKAVKRLLGEARELVIATDADREGEMIARELVEHCRYRGPIQRLWLSALDDASIRKALARLLPGQETFNLYHCALGRSRADWLIGMNMSRLFTLLGRQSGYQGVLPVGRVQTPTLRLVVDRDRSIADFVPVPFWAIDVQLESAGNVFNAQWRAPEDACDDQGRCLKQALAQQAALDMQTAGSARVMKIATERVREAAPMPFDLGTLQEVCSKKLGLGAQETLDIAQALYETHKLITYPRSDSGYLPLSQHGEAPSILAALQRTDGSLAPLQPYLDPQRRSRAWNDQKVSAHHGIIPTAAASDPSRLPPKYKAVYTLIRARYLAQFLPNHEYDRTQADFDCAGHTLRSVGKQIIEPGWRRALPEALTPRRAARRHRPRCCRHCARGRTARCRVCSSRTCGPSPQAIYRRRPDQGDEERRQAGAGSTAQAEAQGDHWHRHRGDSRKHHPGPARSRLPGQERQGTVGHTSSLQPDRCRTPGHRRPRHHGDLGTGAGHGTERRDEPGRVRHPPVGVDGQAGAALQWHAPEHHRASGRQGHGALEEEAQGAAKGKAATSKPRQPRRKAAT